MHKTDAELQDMARADLAQSPFRVGVMPVPGFALMAYACLVDPLRAANLLSGKILYDIVHFSSGAVSQSSVGALVERNFDVGDMPELDLLLVVAGGDPFQFSDRSALRWLTRMAQRVPQIGGVSGGPVILAKAGVMNGRRMTVHWEHAAELAERHPDLIIDKRLYVMDRDRMTCGGGTAPIDLMHALITQHHGGAFARSVTDWFSHTEIRAAAAPQRALPLAQTMQAPEHVVAAVAAMEDHIADPLTLSLLALTTGVSERQLTRLFQQTFGQSAMAYYRKLRLDVARRLVTGSRMQLSDVAQATGFSSAAHFSNQYMRAFGRRPKQDRVQPNGNG